MEYLLGLLAALVGGLFYFKRKANTAEALNENIEANSKVLQESVRISELQKNNEAERENRKAIQSSMEEGMKKDATAEELVDFVNTRNKR
jgi:hypothetical protein